MCVLSQKKVINYSVYTSRTCHTSSRLQVHEHSPGHVLAGPTLREEGVERVISDAFRVVPRNGAVRVDPVL